MLQTGNRRSWGRTGELTARMAPGRPYFVIGSRSMGAGAWGGGKPSPRQTPASVCNGSDFGASSAFWVGAGGVVRVPLSPTPHIPRLSPPCPSSSYHTTVVCVAWCVGAAVALHAALLQAPPNSRLSVEGPRCPMSAPGVQPAPPRPPHPALYAKDDPGPSGRCVCGRQGRAGASRWPFRGVTAVAAARARHLRVPTAVCPARSRCPRRQAAGPQP